MTPTWLEMRRLFSLEGAIDDPAANIAAGAAYLRVMYDRFGFPGVFAAYNAGPRRYGESLHGRPLPPETGRYVDAILARLGGQEERYPTGVTEEPIRLFATAGPMQGPDQGTGEVGRAQDQDSLFVLRRW